MNRKEISYRDYQKLEELMDQYGYPSNQKEKSRRKKPVPKALPRNTPELDLHGLTRKQGMERVKAFIETCRVKNSRSFRVIYGRGLNSPEKEPVLKQTILQFLRKESRAGRLEFMEEGLARGASGSALIHLL